MQGTSWNTCRLGGLRCKTACFCMVHGRANLSTCSRQQQQQQVSVFAMCVCHCARMAVLSAVSWHARWHCNLTLAKNGVVQVS